MQTHWTHFKNHEIPESAEIEKTENGAEWWLIRRWDEGWLWSGRRDWTWWLTEREKMNLCEFESKCIFLILRDIPGEPGNWVPTTSYDLSRNTWEESRFFMIYTSASVEVKQFPYFLVKGKHFLRKKLIFSHFHLLFKNFAFPSRIYLLVFFFFF